jgi:hypothetical protein
MIQGRITPQNTEFVILCFEGPDQYSMAGGLGVRVANLSATLAKIGFQTHLFFVGDPALDSVEFRQNGKLVLHRMCQWISKYHPNGVYEAEEAKLYDYNESTPHIIKDEIVKPAVANGKLVVVLAEEWHTAEALCRLSDYLYHDGLRDKAIMYWNANNLLFPSYQLGTAGICVYPHHYQQIYETSYVAHGHESAGDSKRDT